MIQRIAELFIECYKLTQNISRERIMRHVTPLDGFYHLGLAQGIGSIFNNDFDQSINVKK